MAAGVMTIRAIVGKLGVVSALAADLMQFLFVDKAVKGSTTMITARAVFLVSLSHVPLMHNTLPLVPFLLDVPIHIAYLASIFRYMSAPMADIFTSPKHASATQQLCRALAALPTRQADSLTQPRSLPTPGPCGAHHVWLIILFFQLFVGFCLPLYISYSVERNLKLRFLRRERERLAAAATAIMPAGATALTDHSIRTTAAIAPAGSATPSATPAAAPQQATWASTLMRHPLVATARAAQRRLATISGCVPFWHGHVTAGASMALRVLRGCCVHACMLGLLAALSWQLVVALHMPLARHVKLLDFPGARYSWYWELVCGGAGPCCPA